VSASGLVSTNSRSYREFIVHTRYKKIRHTYIRINQDKSLLVSAPLHADDKHINAVIDKFYNNILHKQQLVEQSTQQHQQDILFQNGDKISYLGQSYCLQIISAKHNYLAFNGDTCVLNVKDVSTEYKTAVLQAEYKRLGMKICTELLQQRFTYFAVLGYKLPRLSLKVMRTRWGSYSVAVNKVNLNLALIKLEPKLIDYVVVHELCHIIEQNHSSRFYALMNKILPNWKELKKELNSFSNILR
jgi:predicted metal-dependent hydrolase